MYEAYLFDLDGTLVDTASDLHMALNYTLSQCNMGEVDYELARHWVGHGAKKMMVAAFEKLQHPAPLEAELDELYEVFLSHYRKHIAEFSQPYFGVRLTLQHLRRRGIPLGIVTNKREDLSKQLTDELELSQFVNVIVGSDTLPRAKPAADPALYACERLGTTPETTLFVGDSITDVSCARAAGCSVVVVPDGYNHGRRGENLGADRVIHSFVELL